MRVITATQHRARKTYVCNACQFLFNSDYGNLGATISEYRQIAAALQCNGMIYAGDVYGRAKLDNNGRIDTVRYKPDIDAICRKYNLYYE